MSIRVLKAIRLSRETDETTSPQRQDEKIEGESAGRGWTVVGEARDLNVSASKVSPFDRPELGPWLNERAHEFDAIIWWRLDRAVRSMSDLHILAAWAKKNKKRLVFVEGPYGGAMELDMTSPVAELIATILAFAAQMEALATSERVTGAHAYLRKVGRWGGGRPPYGYKAEAIPKSEGAGFRLVIDDEPAEVLRQIVARVIAGESRNSICMDLNRRGVTSPAELHRTRTDKDLRGDGWDYSTINKILRNPAMLGQAVHNNRVVLGDDGMPLLRAEPIVTQDEFDAVQREIDGNIRLKMRKQTASLVLNVGFCECGGSLYKWVRTKPNGKTYSYYRCSRKSKPVEGICCPNPAVHTADMDKAVEELFIGITGHLEVLEKKLIPGAQHTKDRERVEARMAELRADREAGLYDGDQAEEYRSMYLRLQAKRDELAALPDRPDVVEMVPTGVTFRDKWESLTTTEEKRAFLLASGLKITLHEKARPTAAAFIPELFTGPTHSRLSFEVAPDLWERVKQQAAK